MRDWVAFNNSTYPVSDEYAARIDSVFGQVWPSEDAAKAMLTHILELDKRGLYTDADEPKKLACDLICNLHNKVRHLAGRDHIEFFQSIDQVGGNVHIKPCGCHLQTIYDWHAANWRGESVAVHPHYPKKVCERHKPLADDFKAHHHAVMEEYRSKPDA